MTPALIMLTAAAATLLALHALILLAPALKLLDHPGGRKNHGAATPLVGGLAIAANVSRLEKHIGFKPGTPIETGIAKFVAWYRDYYSV